MSLKSPSIVCMFAHNYQIREISADECRASSLSLIYSAQVPDLFKVGNLAIVECRPGRSDASPFAFTIPINTNPYLSGVFTTADPDKLMIVSDGDGSVVNANNPCEIAELSSMPILAVHCLVDNGLMILHDYTAIEAYRGADPVWRSGRILRDGLTIDRIDEEWIYGYGDDTRFPNDSPFGPDGFKLNFLTGDYFGGGGYFPENPKRIGEL